MPDHEKWLRQLLLELQLSGQAGADTVRYLAEHKIRVVIHPQPTAARWTLRRRIELHPRYLQDSVRLSYPLSLVLHEATHIRQGVATALSVYGELEAWQAQFTFLKARDGEYARAVGDRSQLIDRLLALRLGWDRETLRAARALMRQYAGERYRIDLLPLYPWHREVAYSISSPTHHHLA